MKKKNYLLFLLIAILTSCNQNEEEIFTTHDVWVMGYKTSSMSLDNRESCSTHFFFFPSSVLSKVELKSYTAKNVLEFGNEKDPIFLNLYDNGTLKAKDGTIIKPVFDIFVPANAPRYGIVSIPLGKYVVFALSKDVKLLSISQAGLKYCIKEIEVMERPAELILSPTFPTTYSMYGLIPWVDRNEEFSYIWK